MFVNCRRTGWLEIISFALIIIITFFSTLHEKYIDNIHTKRYNESKTMSPLLRIILIATIYDIAVYYMATYLTLRFNLT